MKKAVLRISMLISLSLYIFSISSAQIVDIGKILAGGVDDAEEIFGNYLRPVANGLGGNLNGGWYNTAKVHKLGGFDITFATSLAFFPEADKTYDLSELTLNAKYDDNIAPTVAGSKGVGPELFYEEDVPVVGTIEYLRFDHPGGTGMNFIPSPMITAGLGLIKETEVRGRYMPTIKFGGDKANTVDLWGIGLVHSLKQWLPFVKRVPVLHLSLMYGYTNVKFHSNLTSILPSDLGFVDLTSNVDWDSQNMDMKIQGHTANLLVSANLPVVCFYGGLGFSVTKTNLNVNGYYPIPTVVTDPLDTNFGQAVVTNSSVEQYKDPIDIEIKNKDGGNTKPRINAGIRFKFAVVTLHFDYTLANYSIATAGLGINFR